METAVYIHRVANYMRMHGQRALSEVQRRSGIETRGRIEECDQRYAFVHQDPDTFFVEPDSDWKPTHPIYSIWIGNTMAESRRVLRAFPFSILHEAMHVVDQNLPHLGPLRYATDSVIANITIPSFFPGSEYNARELALDWMAIQGFGGEGTIRAMVASTRMIAEDLKEGGLDTIGYASFARELTKLNWVINNSHLPPALRAFALDTRDSLTAIIKGKKEDWSTEQKGLGEFLYSYAGIYHATSPLSAEIFPVK